MLRLLYFSTITAGTYQFAMYSLPADGLARWVDSATSETDMKSLQSFCVVVGIPTYIEFLWPHDFGKVSFVKFGPAKQESIGDIRRVSNWLFSVSSYMRSVEINCNFLRNSINKNSKKASSISFHWNLFSFDKKLSLRNPSERHKKVITTTLVGTSAFI